MPKLIKDIDINKMMKIGFIQLKENLLNQELDLQKNPVLFKWSYIDCPEIEYQLLIKEVNPNLDLDVDLVDINFVDLNTIH